MRHRYRALGTIGIASILFIAPLAHAETASVPIGDPFTDTIQLWSAVLGSIEIFAHELAEALQPQSSLSTNNSPKPHAPRNLQQPATLAASAALATEPPPETATTSGSASGTAIAEQQPQSRSPPEGTQNQTTISPFVKSPLKSAVSAIRSAPAFDASAFVTQAQFNTAMSALGASVQQLLSISNPAPPPNTSAATATT